MPEGAPAWVLLVIGPKTHAEALCGMGFRGRRGAKSMPALPVAWVLIVGGAKTHAAGARGMSLSASRTLGRDKTTWYLVIRASTAPRANL